MKYKLIYTHRAIKDIQKLETKVKQRIGKTLLRYEKDPLNYSEKLIDLNSEIIDLESEIIGLYSILKEKISLYCVWGTDEISIRKDK